MISANCVERLVNLLDEHGVLLRSLMGDPSVLHGLRHRNVNAGAARRRCSGRWRGSGDPAAMLRGRCALGVINAGAIAPRFDAVADHSADRERLVRARLSDQEKDFVTAAAVRVLETQYPGCPL